MRKAIFVLLLMMSARPLFAQTAPEGLWQGYDGEWKHVSKQPKCPPSSSKEWKSA
jgi:hypothetical protein